MPPCCRSLFLDSSPSKGLCSHLLVLSMPRAGGYGFTPYGCGTKPAGWFKQQKLLILQFRLLLRFCPGLWICLVANWPSLSFLFLMEAKPWFLPSIPHSIPRPPCSPLWVPTVISSFYNGNSSTGSQPALLISPQLRTQWTILPCNKVMFWVEAIGRWGDQGKRGREGEICMWIEKISKKINNYVL